MQQLARERQGEAGRATGIFYAASRPPEPPVCKETQGETQQLRRR